jgi:hypothetical protein
VVEATICCTCKLACSYGGTLRAVRWGRRTGKPVPRQAPHNNTQPDGHRLTYIVTFKSYNAFLVRSSTSSSLELGKNTRGVANHRLRHRAAFRGAVWHCWSSYQMSGSQPHHQHINGVSTQNHSQAFVGSARDVYFSGHKNPEGTSSKTSPWCSTLT